MAHRSGPRKYDPLTAYLAGYAVGEVTLTLGEIEQIIGQPLPRTAWARGWWVNSSAVRPARAWLTAGWQVVSAALDEGTAAVTFTRGSPDTTAEPLAPPR